MQDLGLGVLEEQDPDANDDSTSSASEDEDDADAKSQPKTKDILGKLMGRGTKRDAAGIEEVHDVQTT